ncbi:TIGR03943 family putative permease subunit [Clostridioides difficile]|uniref:TIGR03943 family putative permease subunit n=1 Tax=Clostridioides difficile TaxID=1496 RepID=UPI000D1D5B88|nr:hypothetical protein [Clostridioides difficile]VIF88616.1 membrane-spanning protein [Clostridioides difficile]VIF96138.1 membrane-spanning protein [Clostridioides difficile]HBE9444107.1 hypothetical protein [Clostridioides difficile]
MKNINKEYLIKLLTVMVVLIQIIYLLWKKEIVYYIHPRMIPYLVISICILLFIALSYIMILTKPKHIYQYGSTKYIILSFLITTLLISYSGLNIDKEKTKVEKYKGKEKYQDKISEKEEFRDRTLEERIYDEKFDVFDTEIYDFLNLLYTKQSVLKGKEVTYVVFVHYDDSLEKNQFIASRSIMVCCAADMISSGPIVNMNQPPKWKEGEWILLTGKIEYKEQKNSSNKTAFLNYIDAKPIEKPLEEVVYPNFG